MGKQRTLVNLVAVGVASAVLVVYATATLVADALRPDTYELFAEVPFAAGLQENKEVSYNGHPVGRVTDADLVGDHVRLRLEIETGQQVPTALDVVVLRRSAIGEQALDLQPIGAVDDRTTFHDPGDTIAPRDLVMPPEIDDFFDTVAEVIEPLDDQQTAAVVAELADLVRGRSDDLRAILVESAEFSRSIADEGESYEELFASGRIVNAELAEHRETLARIFTEGADAASLLTELRADFEALLVEAPPTLTLAGELVRRSQPNLSCSIDYLANLSEYTAQPRVLEDTAEALRNNRFFFEGFDSFTVYSDYQQPWQRVLFLAPQNPPAESFLPEKRPIPDILPGGACSSPFGEGAPAATQVDYERLVPEAQLIGPADDRTAPVRIPARDTGAAGSTARDPGTPTAALPSLLGGGLLVGVAGLLRRHEGGRHGHAD